MLEAPDAARLTVHQEEVFAQDVLRRAAHAGRHLGVERATRQLACAHEGAQVHLAVEGLAVVDRAVEVDAEVGDDEHVLVDVHQAALDAARRLHEHAAGQPQGPVEPGGVDGAAVDLHVQAQVVGRALKLGDGLHLEGGRVGVGGGYLEVIVVQMRAHPERDEAGVVAHGVVAAAGRHLPRVALAQGDKARLVKVAPGRGHRVEHRRGLPDELDELPRGLDVVRVNHCVVGPFMHG